jgi:hypothetical protein
MHPQMISGLGRRDRVPRNVMIRLLRGHRFYDHVFTVLFGSIPGN